ncbi:hypothetical protein SNEBB_006661 [Seison nebaliae]|nr:hypothetical protein SNEBB_006661 [Seison nebaliae]
MDIDPFNVRLKRQIIDLDNVVSTPPPSIGQPATIPPIRQPTSTRRRFPSRIPSGVTFPPFNTNNNNYNNRRNRYRRNSIQSFDRPFMFSRRFRPYQDNYYGSFMDFFNYF